MLIGLLLRKIGGAADGAFGPGGRGLSGASFPVTPLREPRSWNDGFGGV
jgi:hypothetical protein